MIRLFLKNNRDGFVALMSTVIISAILLAFMFSSGVSSFNARFDALEGEYKRVAVELAESCVNEALLWLGQNYNYAGNETVSMGTDSKDRAQTCVIKSIIPAPPRTATSTMVTITTQGIYVDTYSDLQTEALVYNPTISVSMPPPLPPNISIISWQETTSTPP